MKILYPTLLFVAASYVAILFYLYLYQRNIIYLPERTMEGPVSYGMVGVQELRLATVDKVNIIAWYAPPPNADAPVIVYFHGNAGKLADRGEKLSLLQRQGLGVLAVSYRGYGGSGGSPSEEGLYEDGRAAIHYLLNQGIAPDRIALYGESLGSGVAVQMATEFKVRALVLEAPYTSVSQRAAEIYPYIPVRWLLKDHFESLAKITHIHCPVLIFHGEKDPTIPVSHGKRLFEAAEVPKELHLFPEVGHTEFDLQEITGLTAKFIKR